MKSLLLTVASLSFSLSAFAAPSQGEIFSAGIKVVCQSEDIKIIMTPRAPKFGEKVKVEKGSDGIYYVSAKVDAQVIDTKSNVVIDRLILDDNTDPWEAAWPVYQNDQLSFYSQDEGRPTSLKYKGADLAAKGDCQFE